ncbi:hypothetical protein TNCV_4451121 [Trichonephila clavipes]|nr:hypothetical protein TNCV_4451121 [Trichonephila clavipes]
MMGRRLHLPGNVDELDRQLEQIFYEIPQETIRELYHSMPLHVAACIQPRDFVSQAGSYKEYILGRQSDFDLVAAVAEWYRYRIVACLVMSSSPVPLKTRRVAQRCTLNLSRAETEW